MICIYRLEVREEAVRVVGSKIWQMQIGNPTVEFPPTLGRRSRKEKLNPYTVALKNPLGKSCRRHGWKWRLP
jgi:hypothetical protein